MQKILYLDLFTKSIKKPLSVFYHLYSSIFTSVSIIKILINILLYMKKNSSESSQQIYEKQAEQKAIESPFYDQYCRHISIIDQKSQQFSNIIHKLKQNGFEYNKQFSFDLKKTIVKSSKDSAKYQIEYGYFKTFVFALFASYNFSKIKRQEIDSGRYGTIFRFTYESEQIIAKSFSLTQFKQQQLNLIIRELFWVKFASILDIGPKFINKYGFDLIFLQGSCEYLMEECQNDVKNIKMYKNNSNFIIKKVMKIIRILHSFHAIHGDIKQSHISRSQKNQSIVLLDFGMSKFIKEQIGKRTMSEYFGTYTYSSPDMRKAYILKSALPVDLFYNDLYGVFQCKKSLQKQSPNFFAKSKLKTQKIQNQWESVAKFFQFKFHIFEQNFGEAFNFCLKQKQLVQCFRQIIKIEQKDIMNKFIIKFQRQLSQKINYSSEVNQVTSVIYTQIILQSSKSIFYQIQMSQSLIRKMYQEQTLQIFLSSSENMENIFQFIFQPQQLCQLQIIQRKKIIKYIFLTKNSLHSHITQTILIRTVLLMFQDYFYKSGNLEKLIIIQNIFRLTCQIKYLKKVQQNISQIFLKNSDLWLNYYKKEISSIFNTKLDEKNLIQRKNVRNYWIWITTEAQFRKKWASKKNQQLIKSCANIILAIDRKLSSQDINVKQNDEQLLHYALKIYEEQLLKEGKKINVFSIDYFQGEPSLEIAGIRQYLSYKMMVFQYRFQSGIQKWHQYEQYALFKTQLDALSFVLRETVWNLVQYIKNDNIAGFENCLEQIFEDVFVVDMYEGIQIFVTFSKIFLDIIERSDKIKQLMNKFLYNINAANIICQIKDDAQSLKIFTLNFSQLVFIYSKISLDHKEVVLLLGLIFQQISLYLSQNSHQWWAVPESEIIILFQFASIYFSGFKNCSQKLSTIDKIARLIKKMPENKQTLDSFSLMIIITSLQLLNLNSQNRSVEIGRIWQLLKAFQNKNTLCALIERNLFFFVEIIRKLVSDLLFSECLSVLEEYARQVNTIYIFINKNNLRIFYQFVELLPLNVANEMFLDKLNQYALTRIGKSPRLSFIFLYLFQKKSFKLKKIHITRYLKLICFGLSKIKSRFDNYIEINGCLLRLYRLYMPLNNDRKQRTHWKRQARISHSQVLFKELSIKKAKTYRQNKKISNKEDLIKNTIQNKLKQIEKIINENISQQK